MRAVTLLGLLLALLCLQGMEAQVTTSKMEPLHISSKREPLSPQNGNLYLLSNLSIFVPLQVWDVDRLIRARNPGASFTTTERPNTTWGTLRSITYNPLFQVLILKKLDFFSRQTKVEIH